MFSLARVDDRVIHGQIVTAWCHVCPCEAIIVVDDGIANDPTMKMIFKNAAIGKNCYIFTLEQALIKVREATNSLKQYFIIAKSPVVYANLLKNGIYFCDKLILGPVSGGGHNRKLIAQTTSLNAEEIEACNYLESHNVEVVFQVIPDKPAIPWKRIVNK